MKTQRLLTFICTMGKQLCPLRCYIESRPITTLWIHVTMQRFDSGKDQTTILDALLMLYSETDQQSFGAQLFLL